MVAVEADRRTRITPAGVISVALFVLGLSTSSANPTASCEIFDYYDGLCQRDILTWTRDDLEDLIRRTHSTIVPFFGSDADEGNTDKDILQALLILDAGSPKDRESTIQLFYSNKEVPQYPLDRSIWVPEHVCPLFMTEEMTIIPTDFDWAYADLHNIRPAHPLIHESSRGTQFFGICPTCLELFEEGSDTCVCGDFFQPPEEARGVVARTWLYMQLRYPDLHISNCHLEQILAWHMFHPPTMEERLRNDGVCEFQGNRNPYVDFPDLAWNIRIHETECSEDLSYGDSSITGTNIFKLLPNFQDEEAETDDEVDYAFDIDIDIGNDEEDGERGGFLDIPQATKQLCESLSTGDAFFYVIQAMPTRLGLLPLQDLPAGLELYMSTTLAFDEGVATATVRSSSSASNTDPLMRITLEEGARKGNPLGFGRNLLLGNEWEVLTQPIMLKGDSAYGDEVFLFCYDENNQVKLLSAITTKGYFKESDHPLLQSPVGNVVLPNPLDYYVYNGPTHSSQIDYQRALMDASNWLGFDLTTSAAGDRESLRVIENKQNQAAPTTTAAASTGDLRQLLVGTASLAIFLLAAPIIE